MDVKGAFDGIPRNRLLFRLQQQGWPQNLVAWVGSSMSERYAEVLFEDAQVQRAPIPCGLPQGSSVAPVLFLLFLPPPPFSQR